jgi:recombination protein RecA
LDVVISSGLGIPRGAYIEMASAPGIGKSTTALHVAKTFCARGEQVIYCDVEQGVNRSQLDGIGLSKYMYDENTNPEGTFHVVAPSTFDEIDELFTVFLKTCPALVFVDSITALLPDKLLDKKVSEIEPGLQARLTANFLIKYRKQFKAAGITVVFINQVRTQIRFRGITTTEAAGGNALKHYCDVRIMLELSERLSKVKENMNGKESVQYGSKCNIFTVKNRWAPPYVSLGLYIIFGRGVSNILSYLDFMVLKGVVNKGSSGVYTIKLREGEEPVKRRGLPATEKWIRENLKDVKEYVEEQGGIVLESKDAEEE